MIFDLRRSVVENKQREEEKRRRQNESIRRGKQVQIGTDHTESKSFPSNKHNRFDGESFFLCSVGPYTACLYIQHGLVYCRETTRAFGISISGPSCIRPIYRPMTVHSLHNIYSKPQLVPLFRLPSTSFDLIRSNSHWKSDYKLCKKINAAVDNFWSKTKTLVESPATNTVAYKVKMKSSQPKSGFNSPICKWLIPNSIRPPFQLVESRF